MDATFDSRMAEARSPWGAVFLLGSAMLAVSATGARQQQAGAGVPCGMEGTATC
jgi:hypothetical protein